MDINKKSYETKNIVKSYARNKKLFESEKILFDHFGESIINKKVLDIGIGGGRTTNWLIQDAASYIGLDYSKKMIDSCKNQYDHFSNSKFYVEDARNLDSFQDESFDFILFSFNGIDCVNYNDRMKILNNCFRLLNKSGHFMFSFHNSMSVNKLYSFQIPKNPFKYFGEIKRYLQVNKLNPSLKELDVKEHFILYDGAENFKASILYINPVKQKNDLEKLNFFPIEFMDVISGKKINQESLNSTKNQWIYVVCRKK